jgi:hypothetical protein
MICPKCNEAGVYNEVLGQGFYYCRTCKDEIQLQEASKSEPKKDEYPRWTTWSFGAGQLVNYTVDPSFFHGFSSDCGDQDCDLCNPSINDSDKEGVL